MNDDKVKSDTQTVPSPVAPVSSAPQPVGTSQVSGNQSFVSQNPTAPVPQPTEVPSQIPVKAQTEGLGTILLVEDDPLLSKMYTAKFTNEGYKVVIAQDGEQGLRLALETNPDIILLDVMMPKLSGLDLLTQLRQNPKGKDIPVLILSNLSQEKEARRALEMGAKEYLLKANFTPSQVVEKIKKYTLR